jgi:DNA polymerase-3 subunit delta'
MINDFIPFSRILGQEKAVRFLKGVLSRERIPHGYLFLGMPGVGKTTTAVALAQALNCQDVRDGEGCGRCKNCRAIQSGNFGDLIFVEPDGQAIKIEQIRELERVLSFRPQFGKYRVTILRESERMTLEAANGFLKTLEEPPHGNVLVLQAGDLSQLMPTIVSRCQKVRFQPIPVPMAAEWLAEKKGVDPAKALLLAKLSEGSIARAVRMWEEDYESRRGESFSRLNGLKALSDGEVLEMAVELRGKGKDREKGSVEVLFSLWKTWFRDLLLLKTGGPERLLIHGDQLAELKRFSHIYKIEELMEGIRLLTQAERDLMVFRNMELMLENLLLALKRLGTIENAQGAGA